MRRIFIVALCAAINICIASAQSKVYFTKTLTPESLLDIYKALGVEATGRVAVKISTGEAGGHIIDWGGKIGLGTKKYKLVNLDKK